VMRNLNRDGVAMLALDERWATRRLSVCAPRDPARITGPVKALLAQLRDHDDGTAGAAARGPRKARR